MNPMKIENPLLRRGPKRSTAIQHVGVGVRLLENELAP